MKIILATGVHNNAYGEFFSLSLREFSELMYVNNDSKARLHKGLLLRTLKRSELRYRRRDY